jgi:hypothetical protein
LKAQDEAQVVIDDIAVKAVKALTGLDQPEGLLIIDLFFAASDFQLSSLPWFSTSPLPSLSTVESLYIYEDPYRPNWEYEIRVENRPFTSIYRCDETLPGRGMD